MWLITEHMLFYASEKYPVEDSYSKYITEVLFVYLILYVVSFLLVGIGKVNFISSCSDAYKFSTFLFICLVD